MATAAVILCAGKGTRMNDNSKNKVCFDCAGEPVVKRIVASMREAGVDIFAVVVGYLAESVMAALEGEKGVFFVYQKEQKGTGHAALCGLRALHSLGFSGSVIVSVGDRIVASPVISELLSRSGRCSLVCGVQPLALNPMGGHVMVREGRPCGVVEMTDAALMSLAGLPESRWEPKLRSLGLGGRKLAAVLRAASERTPKGTVSLAGQVFTASEVLSTPFANASLYCFNLDAAMQAIASLGCDNAQEEIYITDTIEYFARENQAELFVAENPSGMLSFSTKPELREIGRHFMRKASGFLGEIRGTGLDQRLRDIYGDSFQEQKPRYERLLETFLERFHDDGAMIARAPGRVNLMGRHIDHRGGGINVSATGRDTLLVCSMRSDDRIVITNVDPSYPDRSFSISEQLALGGIASSGSAAGDSCSAAGAPGSAAGYPDWISYLEAPAVVRALTESRGDWSNYVKGAVLRFQFESGMPLCGMNIAFSGNIPVAAGLSSSSSIVVAVAEAVVALNCMNPDQRRFVELCGEGEWFVGSRGGAGDHAAMKCSRSGMVTHLDFKPFRIGESVRLPLGCAVVVADTGIRSRKSEGSRDVFNARVAAYEFALMYLRKLFPLQELAEFRDLAQIRPFGTLYRMLAALPTAATREEIAAFLPGWSEALNRIFSTHADPGSYDLRGVALFGVAECCRSARLLQLLSEGRYAEFGEMMSLSHDGDRSAPADCSDATLARLAEEETDPALVPGAYRCSLPQIDALCDLLDSTPGVLGSQMAGAGLGGCVIALVEAQDAASVLDVLRKSYYDRYGVPFAAEVLVPSSGSAVIF